jgi:glutamate/tyrosine decarboxylase-like PLP-dependent enzyme
MSIELSDSEGLLRRSTDRALAYLRTLDRRPVFPSRAALDHLDRLPSELSDAPMSGEQVIDLLDRYGSPGTVATNGGRYFGFVTGSALPVALASNWLAGAWNQNAALTQLSPVAARLERTSLGWIRDLLGLPARANGAFVTGASLANFVALSAARHAVLQQVGYNVEARGLSGAPRVRIVVSEEAHSAVIKDLVTLGFGRDELIRVPTDSQGRMRADALPRFAPPSILCLQAGNVNTGSFDPMLDIVPRAKAEGAWVHVDGAFGLWAAAAPARRMLVRGAELADSWGVDCHKWLNVPYDSGALFVRDRRHLTAAMASGPATYLGSGVRVEARELALELSRRARGVEAWAALMSLGRTGVADLVETCCQHAARFAELLSGAGFKVLNEVVLNQVLVSFGDDERTRNVVRAIQSDGSCWCGDTVWKGRAAMRISVCSAKTTDEDVELSARAMIRCANAATRVNRARGGVKGAR